MTRDDEIDRNLFAFRSVMADLLGEHRGHFAVLRQQKIVSIHERLSQALAEAGTRFQDGLFSIQQITDKPVDLGFFSHASHPG